MKTILAAVALCLSGCGTIMDSLAEDHQREQAEQQQAAAKNMQSLANRCSQFGFSGNAHSQCMLQLHQQNQASNAAIAGALIGAQAQQQPRPAYQLPPVRSYYNPATPRTTTCAPDGFGGQRCTTY